MDAQQTKHVAEEAKRQLADALKNSTYDGTIYIISPIASKREVPEFRLAVTKDVSVNIIISARPNEEGIRFSLEQIVVAEPSGAITAESFKSVKKYPTNDAKKLIKEAKKRILNEIDDYRALVEELF